VGVPGYNAGMGRRIVVGVAPRAVGVALRGVGVAPRVVGVALCALGACAAPSPPSPPFAPSPPAASPHAASQTRPLVAPSAASSAQAARAPARAPARVPAAVELSKECRALVAPPVARELGEARAWLEQQLAPGPAALDALGLTMWTASKGTPPGEATKRQRCAARLLESVTGKPRERNLSPAYPDRLRFVGDSWLLEEGAPRRLYATESGRQFLAVPAKDSPAPDEAETREWESTADGPVQRLPNGKTRLFRHLSDVESDGGFSVWQTLSSDGSVVITAGRGDTSRGEELMAVRAWHAASARVAWQRRFPAVQRIVGVHFSPDGKRVGVLGVHYNRALGPDQGTLFMLDGKSGRTLWTFRSEEPHRLVPGGSPAPFSDLVWFRDSKRLVIAYASSARILDADGKRGVRLSYGEPDPNYVSLALDPSERWLVVQRQLAGNVLLLSLDGHRLEEVGIGFAQTSFSPSGRYLLVTDSEKPKLYELADSPKPIELTAGIRCRIDQYELPLAACD
jgi:hypothetical protein